MIRSWLSDIVPACPDKLAGRKRTVPVICNYCLSVCAAPWSRTVSESWALAVAEGYQLQGIRKGIDSPALYSRTGFTSVNLPVGVFGMMFIIKSFKIIVAHDICKFCTFLGTFCHHIIWGNCNRRISFGIKFFYSLVKSLCDFKTITHVGIVDLITNRPHDKTWMISSASYPGFYIAFAPFVKVVSIIKFCFWFFPHVKGFIVYKKSHFVAEGKPGLWRRIMRTTHCIYAHFLKFCKLTSQGSFIKGGS